MQRFITGATALTLLVAGAPAAAQSSVGIKAGASFGNISNKGVLPGSLGTRTGVAGGIFLGTGSSLLSLGVEGLYAQRGLRTDENIADAETRLDYVDLPLYLKVQAPVPALSPFAYAGPQISFEVKCAQADGGPCAADPARKKTTFAGVIGGGIRFGMLSVEGRYLYGLTDLDIDTVTNSESYRDRTFMLLLGLHV
ncbi:MAG: porin family protein [Gemmatimonadales bacterium]